MNINLNLLKYFYEVVKEKNITKAAKNLYVTQPAITRAIKELEKNLNTKLLKRNQKGVLPTKEGVILYNPIENIFKEIDITKEKLKKSNDKNELYIGTTTSNIFTPIANILKEFQKEYPNIKVHIIFEKLNILEEMIKTNKIDILIKNSNETIKDFIKYDEIKVTNYFIALKEDYKELIDKKIDIKTLLKNYPIVTITNSSPGRINFDNFLKSKNIKYKPNYEFNSYDLCKKIVDAGIGIGLSNNFEPIDKKYFIINTDKIPPRIFEIGYINTVNNQYIKKFFKIYDKIFQKNTEK